MLSPCSVICQAGLPTISLMYFPISKYLKMLLPPSTPSPIALHFNILLNHEGPSQICCVFESFLGPQPWISITFYLHNFISSSLLCSLWASSSLRTETHFIHLWSSGCRALTRIKYKLVEWKCSTEEMEIIVGRSRNRDYILAYI